MFELSVVTPQGPTLESVQVDEVTAPGVEGEFGVLPGHIPFISATKAGVLSYRKGGETSRVAVGTSMGDGRVRLERDLQRRMMYCKLQ